MSSSSILLQTAVAAPLVAAVLMAFSKRIPPCAKKIIAGVGFVVPALAALALCVLFPNAEKTGGYAFYSGWECFGVPALGTWLQFGLDGISLPLFLMAAVVGLAAGLRAVSTKNLAQPGLYFAVILVMFGGVLGVFSAVDVFSFYIFHEFALIPTFIAILLWGGFARKTTAITMAVYLTLGAMISLAGLLAFYFAFPPDAPFSFIGIRDVAGMLFCGNASAIFAILLFGFGILVSLFPFHSWAPNTYSAAPTPISMLHAGVLKKFGLYGLIQIGAAALPLGLLAWQNWIIWLALGNIVLIGLITMTQKDLKQMISYSSVMHMGPIFLGIAAFAISGGNVAGLGGAVVLMFAHGLSVALLFHLGQAVCDRTGTYEMAKMGGLTAKAPVLAAFFVAATMASIGLPGFANFWGELTIFTSLAQIQPSWLLGAIVLSIVISAIYGLRAVAKIFYGKNSGAALTDEQFEKVKDITLAERVPALILFAALVAVGFVPSLITKNLDATLADGFAAASRTLSGETTAPACVETVFIEETTLTVAPEEESGESVPAQEAGEVIDAEETITVDGDLPVVIPAENGCENCGVPADGAPVLAKSISVSVSGSVGKEGEFVLSGEDATLLKLLEMVEPDPAATYVSVLRLKGRFLIDIEELRNGDADDLPLEDGDKIAIE